MKRIRWHLVLLTLCLVFFLNIERLEVTQGATVNLSRAFYITMGLIVTLLLCIPLRRYQSQGYLVAIAVLSVFVLLKILGDKPLLTGVNKYVLVTEVAGLVITSYFAWQASKSLYDFEAMVEAISLPEGSPRLLSADAAQERLETELKRARRHHRPLSIALIEADPAAFKLMMPQAVRDIQNAMLKRYVQVQLSVFLSKYIRETDVVAQHERDGRFLLVAPDTSAPQTEVMLKRLAHEVRGHHGVAVRYSTVDFPNAAITKDELLHSVKQHLQDASIQEELQTGTPLAEVPTAVPVSNNGQTAPSEI